MSADSWVPALLLFVSLVSGNAMAQEFRSLPTPHLKGAVSLEEALAARRSVREYSQAPLSEEQVGQLLWAAQGITEPSEGLRTAPSAGALHGLEIYLINGRVEGLPTGVYHYDPHGHRLQLRFARDPRESLTRAAHGQAWVSSCAALFVIAAVEARLAWKYGERAERYVTLEAGHAAQNLLLEATALHLGAVPVGAFDDRAVAAELRLHTGERPLYLIPVGVP